MRIHIKTHMDFLMHRTVKSYLLLRDAPGHRPHSKSAMLEPWAVSKGGLQPSNWLFDYRGKLYWKSFHQRWHGSRPVAWLSSREADGMAERLDSGNLRRRDCARTCSEWISQCISRMRARR